jgi:hypothetical protein
MGADVPSPHTFREILLGNRLEYNSNDIDCYASPRMCYHIDGKVPTKEVHELMPLDQSPRSHVNYLQEKVARLQALQVDLEAAEVELKRQSQDFTRQQARTGLLAPCASPECPTTW